MTLADALMLALGLIAVGSGALVVTSAHLVRAGLYLVISLGSVAGLYLVLGAELVAWVQVLVYVGAVVVLLLFAVMLTRAPIGPSPDLDRPAAPAALIGAGVGLGLAALLADSFRWTRYELPPTGTAQRIGEQVFGAWVLPFEVLSILLLAALIGAVVLSRPDLGARPDPDAGLLPVGPQPDPTAESAEVVTRLERIAARQAAAQARVRGATAAGRSASGPTALVTESDGTGTATLTDEPPIGRPGPAAGPELKSQAHDVIFGARAGRPVLGENEVEPPDNRTIEGTSRPGPAPIDRAIEGRPGNRESPRFQDDRTLDDWIIEGESRPASGVEPAPERPALPAKPADEQDGDD